MTNFAIIGCGAAAKIHAGAIKGLENGCLYGVFDGHAERAEHFAAQHGCRAFSSMEELLGCKDVDVVNVCVPSGLHAQVAVAALNAKKHVVVEKPMAITKAQINEIIAAAEQNDVKVAVITQYRFTPATQRVKKALEEGKLGKILLADFSGKYYRSAEYYASATWRGTMAMDGGGALMNQGIHGIDVIQYLMGGVKSVQATCRTLRHDVEVEDSAYLLVEYKNGAIGCIHGTTVASPGYPRRIEINGTKGSIVMEEDSIVRWDVDGDNAETGKRTVNSGADPMAVNYGYHRLQLADLIAAIEEDRAPLVDVYEGKKPVEIILAAYESSCTGRKILLGEE